MSTLLVLLIARPGIPSEVFSAESAVSSWETYLDCFSVRADKNLQRLKQADPSKFDKNDPRLSLYGSITESANYWRLAQAVKRDDYRTAAVELFDCFEALNPSMAQGLDFHLARPWGLLVYEFNRSNLLTGVRRDRTKQLAEAYLTRFWRYYGNGKSYFEVSCWDNNICQAEVCTASLLARTFPELELSTPVIEFADQFLDRVLTDGDLNENASNYSCLGIVYFLRHLQALGRLEDAGKNPKIKNLIARWRDFMSPAGYMPEIGDSYFYINAYPMDIVLVLEIGARLFNEPSFAAEAARINRLRKTTCGPDMLFRAWGLLELEPYRFDPAAKRSVSGVNRREAPVEGETNWKSVPDKLFLSTGTSTTNSFVLCDLYSQGSHAHEFRRAAINYYEAHGVPLFHETGRRGTTSGDFGNVFWVGLKNEPFPPQVIENAWNTMTIPVNRLQPSETLGLYKLGRTLDFRTFGQRAVQYVQFDNLRLEGTGGTKLIDDFSSSASWHKSVRNETPETVADSTEGISAQRVFWGKYRGGCVLTRFLPKDFQNANIDPNAYQYLKFDYKFVGPQPYASIRGTCFRWMDIGANALDCNVKSCFVAQQDADKTADKNAPTDASATIELENYGGTGNQLVRRILLTCDGALVVVDEFTPAEKSRSLIGAAGTLWQLYSLAERGENWFAAESDGAFPNPEAQQNISKDNKLNQNAFPEKRSLVTFYKPVGAECGIVKRTPHFMHSLKIVDGKQTARHDFYTTYSKRQLNPPAETISGSAQLENVCITAFVVQPISVACSPKTIAEQVRFTDLREAGRKRADLSPADSIDLEISWKSESGKVSRFSFTEDKISRLE